MIVFFIILGIILSVLIFLIITKGKIIKSFEAYKTEIALIKADRRAQVSLVEARAELERNKMLKTVVDEHYLAYKEAEARTIHGWPNRTLKKD